MDSSTIGSLIARNKAIPAFALSACLAVLSLVFGFGPLGVLFFVLSFTAFDVLGFSLTMDRDAEESVNRYTYRVLQGAFQAVAVAFVFVTCGAWPAVACMVAWWFCVCDKLYYFVGEYPAQSDYPWLASWSIFALLKFVKVTPTHRNLWIVSILGLALSIFISIQ